LNFYNHLRLSTFVPARATRRILLDCKFPVINLGSVNLERFEPVGLEQQNIH
jgi:hypothetical protein